MLTLLKYNIVKIRMGHIFMPTFMDCGASWSCYACAVLECLKLVLNVLNSLCIVLIDAAVAAMLGRQCFISENLALRIKTLN